MINIKNFSFVFSVFAFFFSFGVMGLSLYLNMESSNTIKSSLNSKYIEEVIESNPEYKFKLFNNGYYYFETEDGESIRNMSK